MMRDQTKVYPSFITVLFFSILCALGINALLHYVGFEREKTGIRKFNLKAMSVTVHCTDSPFAGMDCTICLVELMEGERLRILPECCHSFHADCIDAWLVSNGSCPSCRHSLVNLLLKKPSGVARSEESTRVEIT